VQPVLFAQLVEWINECDSEHRGIQEATVSLQELAMRYMGAPEDCVASAIKRNLQGPLWAQ
jgi:type II secretory pathway component PulM